MLVDKKVGNSVAKMADKSVYYWVECLGDQ